MCWREIELIEELRRRRDSQASAARWAFEKLSVVQSGARRRAIPFLAFGVLAGAGVAALLFFWTQLLRPDDLGAASLPLVAFVAAIASTFNPCGLPALPGFFTFTGAGQDLSRGRRSRLSLSVSLGAISIILIFGIIVAAAGAGTKELVTPHLRWVQLGVGVALIGLAVLHLSNRSERLPGVGRIMAIGSRMWESSIGDPTPKGGPCPDIGEPAQVLPPEDVTSVKSRKDVTSVQSREEVGAY